MPDEDSDASQVQHAQEVVGVPFPARDKASAIVKPGKEAFDLPAPFGPS
jgi:hypothetical protein